MNQHQESAAAFGIDGYYSVRPDDPNRKTEELAFEAAKRDCVAAMQQRIRDIESMKFDRWIRLKRKGI